MAGPSLKVSEVIPDIEHVSLVLLSVYVFLIIKLSAICCIDTCTISKDIISGNLSLHVLKKIRPGFSKINVLSKVLHNA
jgi:hypothetical protein